jgi:hypothetical protein
LLMKWKLFLNNKLRKITLDCFFMVTTTERQIKRRRDVT